MAVMEQALHLRRWHCCQPDILEKLRQFFTKFLSIFANVNEWNNLKMDKFD
jgi:hypothetical protein